MCCISSEGVSSQHPGQHALALIMVFSGHEWVEGEGSVLAF